MPPACDQAGRDRDERSARADIDWLLKLRSPGPFVTPDRPIDDTDPLALSSTAYRITVDGGRDSFFALSIEQEGSDTAWLISDTVCSLTAMQ